MNAPTDEIVQQLRDLYSTHPVVMKAATEIEQLRALARVTSTGESEPLNFSDLRAALRSISEAVGDGYLVSCWWDGLLLRVSIGRRVNEPETYRKPWVMTLDSEADYSMDSARLVADFAHGALVWFGTENVSA